MVSYSTNMMGPVTISWYSKRGLTETVEHLCKYGVNAGKTIEVEMPTTQFAGGRIDIYGVPGEIFPLEYGLPIMHGEDWNDLSIYLESLDTESVLPYNTLIENFEEKYGRKIRWADTHYPPLDEIATGSHTSFEK